MTAHPIDTEALRRLADAATDGPWERNGRNGIHTPIGSCIALTHRHDDDERKADAEFIAAARTAVPALLDENAALLARIKAVEALCDRASRDAGVLDRNLLGGHRLYPKEIRRALDGSVTPPAE